MRIPENLGQISAFPFVRLVGWVVAPELKYRESGRHRCRVNPGSLTGGKSDQVFLDSLFLNRFSWLRYQNVRLEKLTLFRTGGGVYFFRQERYPPANPGRLVGRLAPSQSC